MGWANRHTVDACVMLLCYFGDLENIQWSLYTIKREGKNKNCGLSGCVCERERRQRESERNKSHRERGGWWKKGEREKS